MWLPALSGAAGAAALLAYGVRGRSASLFGPSVWRGPATRKAIALTFDDGPSESTPEILDLLERFQAKATFFQVGSHARRLPQVSRAIVERGHEPGNHSDTHPALYFKSPRFIEQEISLAQQSIEAACGRAPSLFRAPFGARWFGLRAAQQRHGLMGVMWTDIARDWVLDANGIFHRMKKRARPGAIFCFHDGRQLTPGPDISATVKGLQNLFPVWRDAGYQFVTVSDLLCLPTRQHE